MFLTPINLLFSTRPSLMTLYSPPTKSDFVTTVLLFPTHLRYTRGHVYCSRSDKLRPPVVHIPALAGSDDEICCDVRAGIHTPYHNKLRPPEEDVRLQSQLLKASSTATNQPKNENTRHFVFQTTGRVQSNVNREN